MNAVLNSKTSIFLLFLLLYGVNLFSQTSVNGKVISSSTNDAVPFANIYFQGTTKGTTTDFDGYFTLFSEDNYDSLVISYVGYKPKTVPLNVGQNNITIQLDEDVLSLREVEFIAGENPAFEILRNVVNNKKLNDKRSLDAYQYESYTKIEIDIDNLSDKFKNRKPVKKIRAVMDSIEVVAGEDGKPLLPVLFSEAISEFYFRNNPRLKKEIIKKTKVSGIGITDGTLTSQFIGSSF